MSRYRYYSNLGLFYERFVTDRGMHFFYKSSFSVELRVRVSDDNFIKMLLSLSRILCMFSTVSGTIGSVNLFVEAKWDNNGIIEVVTLLSGYRAKLFLSWLSLVVMPLYILRYGYSAEWLLLENGSKVCFCDPGCFFNYVGGFREFFEEFIILSVKR